ncbi:serine endopeptidase [Massilia sp. R2A-15]|uniref:zinc ribbon domain-containing protein n=1 Tax=Massilia sp. R2A-15 TaxID=3064278 RepID=UPI0027372A23|nr:zinc ribbon domain-containing protein [Massilia sp. R2A-15]WLI90091.1 serine endopeptidase [Massilia sp. R2A-15]
MSKGLRLTEKWMQRGLWLVAFVFAGFLIGLGGKIVDNMWRVAPPAPFESFIDPVRGPASREAARQADAKRVAAAELQQQAEQKHEVARSNSNAAQQTFENWLSTRRATARPDQDTELIERTRELDKLKAAERAALAEVQAQQQALLDASQARDRAEAEWRRLETPARMAMERARTEQELRVFLYRLAITLPLLLAAGWLFAKKRHGAYWPFVWGFIFFALFAFFVDLVPYLPSYGGYVRYIVGIVVTGVVGRYAIVSLQRYLERQKAAEALPDVQRRETLRYDTAIARLDKGVCPGCERAIDLKDAKTDFCPHCGIGVYDRCGHCVTRKSAFARFCFSCGTPANVSMSD